MHRVDLLLPRAHMVVRVQEMLDRRRDKLHPRGFHDAKADGRLASLVIRAAADDDVEVAVALLNGNLVVEIGIVQAVVGVGSNRRHRHKRRRTEREPLGIIPGALHRVEPALLAGVEQRNKRVERARDRARLLEVDAHLTAEKRALHPGDARFGRDLPHRDARGLVRPEGERVRGVLGRAQHPTQHREPPRRGIPRIEPDGAHEYRAPAARSRESVPLPAMLLYPAPARRGTAQCSDRGVAPQRPGGGLRDARGKLRLHRRVVLMFH
jgi:hypothetical protein